MVRSFHGGIKKQKRIFGGAPAEGRLILEKDEAFVYFIPCEESACVEIGERVFVGSVLACAEGSCPVLSGVSGVVSGIDENRITVISDGSDEALPALPGFSGSLSETAPDEICARLSDTGVTSAYSPLGIASLCNEARIISKKKRIRLIVNCASPTAALSLNRYLIKKHPEMISGGIRILMRACNAAEAILVCDDSSIDTVRILEGISDGTYVKTVVAEAKYPMQNEKLTVYLAIEREPSSKRTYLESGLIAVDCEAAVNAYRAVACGERTVTKYTVISDGREELCLAARLGQSLRSLISAFGEKSCFAFDEFSESCFEISKAEELYGEGNWGVSSFEQQTSSDGSTVYYIGVTNYADSQASVYYFYADADTCTPAE